MRMGMPRTGSTPPCDAESRDLARQPRQAVASVSPDEQLRADSRPMDDDQERWFVCPFTLDEAEQFASSGLTEPGRPGSHADRLDTLRP